MSFKKRTVTIGRVREARHRAERYSMAVSHIEHLLDLIRDANLKGKEPHFGVKLETALLEELKRVGVEADSLTAEAHLLHNIRDEEISLEDRAIKANRG